MENTTQDNNVATMQSAPEVSQYQNDGRGQQERTVAPRASVYETPEAVILELEMPGADRDTIEVKVENDELTVCGRRYLPTDEGYELLHQERLPLSYKRAFVLSDRIDVAKIVAGCDNGVLKLTLPKSAKAQPRKITID